MITAFQQALQRQNPSFFCIVITGISIFHCAAQARAAGLCRLFRRSSRQCARYTRFIDVTTLSSNVTISSRCKLGVSGAREGPVVARNKRWYVFFSFFFLFFFRLTLSSPKRTPLEAPMREPHEIVIIKYFRFCLLFLHQSAEDHASARRAVCALLLIFDDL